MSKITDPALSERIASHFAVRNSTGATVTKVARVTYRHVPDGVDMYRVTIEIRGIELVHWIALINYKLAADSVTRSAAIKESDWMYRNASHHYGPNAHPDHGLPSDLQEEIDCIRKLHLISTGVR